jgi:hypothetical protein
MKRTTGLARRSATRSWPRVIAAALFFVGTACADQLEATEPAASPASLNDRDASGKLPVASEQGARDAKLHRQWREGRQRRVAKARDARYVELELSDEQRQRVAALREKQRAWRVEHHDELEALNEQQKAAKRGDGDVDAEALRRRLSELYRTLPSENDILAVLTDAQRAQLLKPSQR